MDFSSNKNRPSQSAQGFSSSSKKGNDDEWSSESEKARFGSNSSNNSAFNELQEAPAPTFGGELGNFFKYIAITAGGKSVENNNFRPGNLPPKS